MLNIKYGDKIADYCVGQKCAVYDTVVALSNLGELKGHVKCPKIFCDRIKKWYFECVKCKHKVSAVQGYFNTKNKFECYKCSPNQAEEQKEPKQKIDVKENEGEDTRVSGKLSELKKLIIEKSGNSKFFDMYADLKEGKSINFYNPMNSNHVPLMWNFDYIVNSSKEALKTELFKFFETYFKSFEKSSCEGCKFEPHKRTHMNCIDCSRNDQSMAFVKKDRFAE